MIRTNKTTLKRVVGLSAALVICAGAAFAQTAAPKFSTFNPATYKGKTGKVTIPYAGDCSLVLRKVANGKLGDYLQVNGKSQSVAVPVGSYKLAYYSIVVVDKDENKWSLSGGPTSDAKMLAMEVKPSSDIKLVTCEPLVASIKVTEAGDKVSMSFQMIGSNGDKAIITKMGQGSAAPGFKVLSTSGEVLMSGNFAYG